jgi:NAD(P)-dependent dehydrogenase (short-subunit alcohol dehydrogenase family)
MYTRLEFNLHSVLALVLLVADTLISCLLSPLRLLYLLQSRAPIAPIDLRNQVAIVTGANTGIGRETARKLALHGAVVVLACRDIQKGMEASTQINEELRTFSKASGGACVGVGVGGGSGGSWGCASEERFPFAGAGRAQFMRLDLTQLPSVLDFAAKVGSDFPR